MDEALIRQVEDLGLSEKEARVYLANLILGPSPVQKLADYAGIKRVTTYVILESLVNLGLASQTSQGKKTYFVAEEPERLKNLLDKRNQELAERREGLSTLLPELRNLKLISSEVPRFQYYEGKEAVRAVVKTFLSSHTARQAGGVCGISNLDNIDKFFPEFAQKSHNPDRLTAGMTSKFLYTTVNGPILKSSDNNVNRISRFVPLDRFPFKEDISISDEYVVYLVVSNQSRPVAVSIRSMELADAMRAVFDLAWTAAEKYQQS